MSFAGHACLNEPAHWRLDDGDLHVVTDRNTDFWRETHYGFTRDSGHFFGRDVAGDFTAQLRVHRSKERPRAGQRSRAARERTSYVLCQAGERIADRQP